MSNIDRQDSFNGYKLFLLLYYLELGWNFGTRNARVEGFTLYLQGLFGEYSELYVSMNIHSCIHTHKRLKIAQS